MSSDIINDFAIISKHIKINKQNSEKAKFATTNDTTVISQPNIQQITILDIVAKIQPPFYPLRDEKGYIYDSSVIVVKCGRSHPHKYLIRHIVDGGITKCTTCSQGTKTVKVMRELLEDTLDAPFIVPTEKYDSAESVEFINKKIKLVISFVSNASNNLLLKNIKNTHVSTFDIVRINTTRSMYKFKQELYDGLINNKNLTDKHKVALRALVGIYHDTIISNEVFNVRPYDTTQLPLSESLADSVANIMLQKNPNTNKLEIKMNLNIIPNDASKYLCIENC